jgi:hypothetical protein
MYVAGPTGTLMITRCQSAQTSQCPCGSIKSCRSAQTNQCPSILSSLVHETGKRVKKSQDMALVRKGQKQTVLPSADCKFPTFDACPSPSHGCRMLNSVKSEEVPSLCPSSCRCCPRIRHQSPTQFPDNHRVRGTITVIWWRRFSRNNARERRRKAERLS